MDNDYSIRKAGLNDFPPVMALYRQLWPNQELSEAEFKEKFEDKLDSRFEIFLCLEKDGNIVGFFNGSVMNSFLETDRWLYLNVLVVHQDYRGKGFGRILLESGIKAAEEFHCEKIVAESGYHRAIAHQFYIKNGFQREGMKFTRKLLKSLD